MNASSELLPSNTPTFTLHVYFCNQRHHSSPVPCSCEPEFNESLLLELHPHCSTLDILSLSEQIRFVLTRTTPTGEAELVGTAHIDWRLALSREKVTKSIELIGLKKDGRIPPGILNIQWELLPYKAIKEQLVDRSILEAQMKFENRKYNETKRLFLIYAKQWWEEYLMIRTDHSQRNVKVFAENERGESLPVCCYVRPLVAGRLLEGPRHAARFVSLFGYRDDSDCVGGDGRREEVWQSWDSFLATKSGVRKM